MISLVKVETGKVVKFWKATYSGATLTVTAGAGGTRGKTIFRFKYASVQKAYDAGASRMQTMMRKGFVREENAFPKPPPKPSTPWKSAPAPKWLASAPRDRVAKLTRSIEKAQLSHRKADILSLVKPTIPLRTKRVTRWKGVISRFGGAPDLPHGMKWPMRKKIPFAFIGQLRLDEIAPFDLEHRLPSRGVLSFFMQAWYAHDDYLDDGSVFFFPDPKKLERATPPDAPELAGGPNAVARITPSFALSLPPPSSALAARLKLTREEVPRYWDEVWLVALGKQRHRVLGHPPSTSTDWLKAGMEMLLEVGWDDAAKMSFGDAQPVRCYAKQSAMDRKTFDDAIFTGEQ